MVRGEVESLEVFLCQMATEGAVRWEPANGEAGQGVGMDSGDAFFGTDGGAGGTARVDGQTREAYAFEFPWSIVGKGPVTVPVRDMDHVRENVFTLELDLGEHENVGGEVVEQSVVVGAVEAPWH